MTSKLEKTLLVIGIILCAYFPLSIVNHNYGSLSKETKSSLLEDRFARIVSHVINTTAHDNITKHDTQPALIRREYKIRNDYSGDYCFPYNDAFVYQSHIDEHGRAFRHATPKQCTITSVHTFPGRWFEHKLIPWILSFFPGGLATSYSENYYGEYETHIWTSDILWGNEWSKSIIINSIKNIEKTIQSDDRFKNLMVSNGFEGPKISAREFIKNNHGKTITVRIFIYPIKTIKSTRLLKVIYTKKIDSKLQP